MFRYGLAILLACLVLSTGAGAHPLLLTNTSYAPASESSIAPRDLSYTPLYFVSNYKEHHITEALLTPFPTQGKNSWMGTIKGGLWSCPTCNPPDLERKYPALAKKHVSLHEYTREQHLQYIEDENLALAWVGQLLDQGTDKSGSNWTIVRDMRVTPHGHSRDLIGSIIFIHARQGMTSSVCRASYRQAYDAALGRTKWYVKEKKILHRDVNTNNVLLHATYELSNVVLSDAELVDWGNWIEQDTWNPEEKEIKNSIAHMKREFLVKGRGHCRKFEIPGGGRG